MATHEEIKTAFESYITESEAFETKGVKAAAARARKALGTLGKAVKVRRKEIQENTLKMHNKDKFIEMISNILQTRENDIENNTLEDFFS